VIRYLCSELVALKRHAGETTVNLEEIWEDGAAIEMDEAAEGEIDVGQKVELLCGETRLPGKITLAAKHDFGWRVELAFAPGIKWTAALFQPQHMLNPQELLGKKVAD
jgi:hypothetical protein